MTFSFRRRIRQVDCTSLLQDLDIGPSQLLDDLCALACGMTGADASSVTLAFREEIIVLGRHNMDTASFRRSIFHRSLNMDFVETLRPNEVFPNVPLFNGEIASFQYVARSRIAIEGETVGGLQIYHNDPMPEGSDVTKSVMTNLSALAAEVIESKAGLKLMLKDVFKLVNF